VRPIVDGGGLVFGERWVREVGAVHVIHLLCHHCAVQEEHVSERRKHTELKRVIDTQQRSLGPHRWTGVPAEAIRSAQSTTREKGLTATMTKSGRHHALKVEMFTYLGYQGQVFSALASNSASLHSPTLTLTRQKLQIEIAIARVILVSI